MSRSVGQPSKLTEEIKEKLFGSIKMGLSYKDAAILAGISERTFHNWKRRGEEATSGQYFQFVQELKKAEVIGKATLLGEIRSDPSWQAKAWILERRHPDEFGRQRIEVGVDGAIDINIVIPEPPTEEDHEG